MAKDHVQKRSSPLPGEELHDVRTAGGGTKGDDLGGAHSGRRTARPGEGDQGTRKPRPHGRDVDAVDEF